MQVFQMIEKWIWRVNGLMRSKKGTLERRGHLPWCRVPWQNSFSDMNIKRCWLKFGWHCYYFNAFHFLFLIGFSLYKWHTLYVLSCFLTCNFRKVYQRISHARYVVLDFQVFTSILFEIASFSWNLYVSKFCIFVGCSLLSRHTNCWYQSKR